MPTGGVKTGETLLEAAHRELREEIGYDAAQLEHINTYYTSKSVMHEIAHLYIGRDLTQVQAIPDETEFLEIETFPFEQVLQMVLNSEIRDSMTVSGGIVCQRVSLDCDFWQATLTVGKRRTGL